jgi:hypothetical protein
MQIDQLARLSCENRLIANLQDGRYNRESERCVGGALATWSPAFWPHFFLKSEGMEVLVDKLRSVDIESQDYVLKFYFLNMDVLVEKPPWSLQRALVERLRAGDRRFKQALDSSSLWEDKQWGAPVLKALEAFEPSEPGLDDDDVPS